MGKRNSSQSKENSDSKKEQWDMLSPLLNAVLIELKVLSKSKPNDALNPFKAKSINKILLKVLDLLVDEPTTEFLELLDEDSLPTNSDAVFMIVQFKSAMEQFRKKYYKWSGGDYDWDI